MKVSEYANDVNLSVAEILKKCHELAINVNNKDDYLTDDDIIMLDNTINLISTDIFALLCPCPNSTLKWNRQISITNN